MRTIRRARRHRQCLAAERHVLQVTGEATMARPIPPDDHEVLSDFAGALVRMRIPLAALDGTDFLHNNHKSSNQLQVSAR